jgi:predicted MPP superfamily phosphohydrolase
LPRLVLILLFASAMTSVLVGSHWYLVKRLILDVGVEPPWRGVMLSAVVVLGASLLAQPFAERLLRPALSRLISWPSLVWMGLVFLLVALLGLSDVIILLLGGSAAAAPEGLGANGSAPGLRAAAVVAIALLAGAVGMRSALRPPAHRRLEIELARWPRALDGFRIAQISDLHLGSILGRRFAEHVVSRVNALDPDLVAVTGDLVDGSVRRLADEVAPVAGLRARYGVFVVTGNHDHYSGADSWADAWRALGLRVLRNERVSISAGGAAFDLIGVDDHHGGLMDGGGEDLERALEGRDPGDPAILLAHDPTTFRRSAARGIDLQLSGHTHGGQIWPFGLLVRLAVPHVAGRHRRRGAQLYVSRGTGFWGPPMRLLAPAEISEIVLRSAPPADAVSP